MNKEAEKNYSLWKNSKLIDKDLEKDLIAMENNEEEISDRFYRNLAFGTGGLRGVIGAGTNRMNIYTVAKATRGLGNYLLSKCENPQVAIAYDTRIKSDMFSKTAAGVLADMGITVHIWKEALPTPCLSYTVRELHCDAGIVITASHNPSKYNGYKVYDEKGCQITNEAADKILSEINKVDIFKDFKVMDFETGLEKGLINYVKDSVLDSYINTVSEEGLLTDNDERSSKIVYTPLNGTGLKPVLKCLKQNGFNSIDVVKEQENPDGNFPTTPYPNPEFKETFELALKLAKEKNADLIMATDPDCDRVGVALLHKGEFRLLTGNEVGILLLDYICKRRKELNKMPENPVAVKTIVTSDMATAIAKDYGVEVVEVLTGFKYIGETIGNLEKKNESDRYILGFEESCGYLTKGYVRDKDAVNACLMVAEMHSYYKNKGLTLVDILDSLYEKYGYYVNTLYSFTFEGESGSEKMSAIMEDIRNNIGSRFFDRNVVRVQDYETSIERDMVNNTTEKITLPKSNVIKFILEGGISIVFRPSGTEPKLKVYICVTSETLEGAGKVEKEIHDKVEGMIK